MHTGKLNPHREDDFFKAQNDATFRELYKQEQLMQQLAMSDDEERVKTSIFVSELEQIFKAIMTKVEDRRETEVLTELKRCLPDHFMSYLYIFNMETMESVKPSSHSSQIESFI